MYMCIICEMHMYVYVHDMRDAYVCICIQYASAYVCICISYNLVYVYKICVDDR